MGSLPVQVYKKSGVVFLNFSKKDARKEILEALKDNTYVVIKNVIFLDLLK
jgi:hypothetical protein